MHKPTEHNPGRMSNLHLAAVDGDLEQVKTLLAEYPESANALNINNQPPLFSVLTRGGLESAANIAIREEIFDVLWHATTPAIRKSQDKYGNTVLQLMAVYNFDQLADKILKQAPDLASRPMRTTGEYPIHTAILNNSLNVAKVLFDADPETAHRKTLTLCSPLHYAARYGSKDMVELCCKHQKNTIDVVDREGKTPLAWAIEANRSDIKDFLIAQGADETLLHLNTSTMKR